MPSLGDLAKRTLPTANGAPRPVVRDPKRHNNEHQNKCNRLRSAKARAFAVSAANNYHAGASSRHGKTTKLTAGIEAPSLNDTGRETAHL